VSLVEKVITEIPLIRRYSRHNENQDLRFRTYLKIGNISNDDLDALVQEKTDEVWKQIDCTKCANCCRVLEVVVDDVDIKRLAKRLNITEKICRQRYVKSGEGSEELLKSQPCVFLGADNKCGVYEDRPAACRDFPYLHNAPFRARTLMMLSNLEICPIVFNVWHRLKTTLWPGSGQNRGTRSAGRHNNK
jgi:hypothetical protein